MLRHIALITAAIVPILVAAPLQAQTIDQDAKCLIVSNLFAKNEKNPQGRQIAAFTSFFYLGRLDARASTAQIKMVIQGQTAALQAQAKQKVDLGLTMTSCAKVMNTKGLALQALGQPAAKPK